MKRLLPPLAIACSLAACSSPQSPPADGESQATRATPVPARKAGDSDSETTPAPTRLTVYSGDYDQLSGWRGDDNNVPGYALVSSQLHYALKTGDNVITRSGLPRAIDIAAVSLNPGDAAVSVIGQRFLSPPAGADALLSSALGQRVAVEQTSGNAKQTDSGILVAAGDGLVLALPDGRTKVISNYDNLSLLNTDRQPITAPALRWQVGARNSGDAAFTLSYPTGGLAWRAEYRATLSPGDDCKLSLDGAAMVTNRSGVAFDAVALTLVAGEPNRVSESAMSRARDVTTFGAVAAAPPAPQPRTSGEYYAYPIPTKATLADGGIERVLLFAPQPVVACKRAYETAPATNVWQPPRPLVAPTQNDSSGPQPVKATVSFDNTKAAGLGRPLPAGRVRLFDGDDFLGESQLAHTPEGADLHLEVGTAFDLSAERTRKSFDVDRAGRRMTESFAITLRNAKDTDVVITVVEPLPRWSEWNILDSSVKATRRDAQHVQFEVPVSAKGETVLTYTVRYTWPQGVKP